MMTPTARSMTLPLKAKFLNSSKSENAFLVGSSDATLLVRSTLLVLLQVGSSPATEQVVTQSGLLRRYYPEAESDGGVLQQPSSS